jgi:enamine deaminase RidA (YjgF/YER057c/UK114 family)
MKRTNISSGAKWESIVGYSRLVRVGDMIFVTGTTATLPGGGHVEGGAYEQAKQVLVNIEAALAKVGASMKDVVRTRMFVTDIKRDWQEIGRAHGEVFGNGGGEGGIMPATTMVEVRGLIEEWMVVEIEADAVVTG